MIIYVTSVSQPWKLIKEHVQSMRQDQYKHYNIMLLEGNLIPVEQLECAENIIHYSNRCNIIVASTYELPILRISRRIRESSVDISDKFIVRVLTRSGFKDLKFDRNGEFIDKWPEGFFDERINELF